MNLSNKYLIKSLSILVFTVVLAACSNPVQRFDILIVGGSVIDGTGKSAFRADIGINADTIAWIGNAEESKVEAKKMIDATGKTITPGFIDPHSHGDPIKNYEMHNFLAQGVTTITLGQDGESVKASEWLNWISKIDSVGTGANVTSFLGHGTIRDESGVPVDKSPDSVQMASMLEKADFMLENGAFGMSTGLEYIPGLYAQEQELMSLAAKVGEKGGMIMSHTRNEDDYAVDSSLRELIAQGTKTRVQVSHLKVVYGNGKDRAESLLALLDSARNAGIDIKADIYPYTASHTGIGIVFPEWAKAPNDYEKVKAERRSELKAYLTERVNYRNGPSATLFGTAPWSGKTLQQVADSLKKDFADVLIDDIGPTGASGAYFVMNEELQERLLQWDFAMVCTDGSGTMHHPRGHGSFSKVIEDFVFEKNLFPLETAIYKMTGLTAASMNMRDRGVLKVGNKADILVFVPEQVKDHATFSEPHVLSEGMDWILVNGRIAKSPEGYATERAGRFIQKN